MADLGSVARHCGVTTPKTNSPPWPLTWPPRPRLAAPAAAFCGGF